MMWDHSCVSLGLESTWPRASSKNMKRTRALQCWKICQDARQHSYAAPALECRGRGKKPSVLVFCWHFDISNILSKVIQSLFFCKLTIRETASILTPTSGAPWMLRWAYSCLLAVCPCVSLTLHFCLKFRSLLLWASPSGFPKMLWSRIAKQKVDQELQKAIIYFFGRCNSWSGAIPQTKRFSHFSQFGTSPLPFILFEVE